MLWWGSSALYRNSTGVPPYSILSERKYVLAIITQPSRSAKDANEKERRERNARCSTPCPNSQPATEGKNPIAIGPDDDYGQAEVQPMASGNTATEMHVSCPHLESSVSPRTRTRTSLLRRAVRRCLRLACEYTEEKARTWMLVARNEHCNCRGRKAETVVRGALGDVFGHAEGRRI